MSDNKRKSRIIINFLIAALVLLGWAIMAFRQSSHGALAAAGIASLKYFTVQSNVFRGIVALFIALFLLRNDSGQPDTRSRKLAVWNYMSTCSVGLTFLVVFAFLGPLYGLPRMLIGGNFFFHLVVPVLSMAELVVFNEEPVRFPKRLLAAVPPILYGLGYLINLLVNGIGYGPRSNDWYGFAIWGIPVGLCIFAVICAASVLIGVLLLAINGAIQKKQK